VFCAPDSCRPRGQDQGKCPGGAARQQCRREHKFQAPLSHPEPFSSEFHPSLVRAKSAKVYY